LSFTTEYDLLKLHVNYYLSIQASGYAWIGDVDNVNAIIANCLIKILMLCCAYLMFAFFNYLLVAYGDSSFFMFTEPAMKR